MTDSSLPVPVDHRRCGKKKKRGEGFCSLPAGWATDHVGTGACKLHGGKSLVRHGRYSTIKRESLRELIEKHEADPDPLNVLPELAAARALFQDFIERYDRWREALFGWFDSWQPRQRPIARDQLQALRNVLDDWRERLASDGTATDRQEEDLDRASELVDSLENQDQSGRPREILDISDAIKHVDIISRVISRVEAARSQNAITRPNLYRLMGEMGRVVEHHNTEPDPDVRLQKIRDGWLAIRT